jgi:hypothetical protein
MCLKSAAVMEPILPWGLTKGSASDARFTLATRERKCYLLGNKSLAVIVTIAFSVVGVLGGPLYLVAAV